MNDLAVLYPTAGGVPLAASREEFESSKPIVVLDDFAFHPPTLLSWARQQAAQAAAEWPGTSKAEERRLTVEFARDRWAEINQERRRARP